MWETLKEAADGVEAVLKDVTVADLLEAKVIQGHDTNKMQAVWHSITHFQGHVQEIIGLTRQQLGPDYVFDWSPGSAAEGA